jgi:hypothetical protein
MSGPPKICDLAIQPAPKRAAVIDAAPEYRVFDLKAP